MLRTIYKTHEEGPIAFNRKKDTRNKWTLCWGHRSRPVISFTVESNETVNYTRCRNTHKRFKPVIVYKDHIASFQVFNSFSLWCFFWLNNELRCYPFSTVPETCSTAPRLNLTNPLHISGSSIEFNLFNERELTS